MLKSRILQCENFTITDNINSISMGGWFLQGVCFFYLLKYLSSEFLAVSGVFIFVMQILYC